MKKILMVATQWTFLALFLAVMVYGYWGIRSIGRGLPSASHRIQAGFLP